MSGYEHDRGAFPQLTFSRCARGFTLRPSDPSRDYLIAPTFAFDRIEDLAVWLIDQYRNTPEPEEKGCDCGACLECDARAYHADQAAEKSA